MTNRISSYSQTPPLPDRFTSPAATLPGASALTASAGSTAVTAPSGEAVTLTPDAQTSTDLLEAARAAPDVDQQTVQSLKSEINSGTYQVPPERLAAAIIAAGVETRS